MLRSFVLENTADKEELLNWLLTGYSQIGPSFDDDTAR